MKGKYNAQGITKQGKQCAPMCKGRKIVFNCVQRKGKYVQWYAKKNENNASAVQKEGKQDAQGRKIVCSDVQKKKIMCSDVQRKKK